MFKDNYEIIYSPTNSAINKRIDELVESIDNCEKQKKKYIKDALKFIALGIATGCIYMKYQNYETYCRILMMLDGICGTISVFGSASFYAQEIILTKTLFKSVESFESVKIKTKDNN